MQEITIQSKQFNPKEFKIVAHPDVIARFLQEEREYLKILSNNIDKVINLHSQSFIDKNMYDIILVN